jgi:hypothetical protein
MTLIRVLTKASSLIIVTFDFMKAKIPFSGKAGKMYPGSFFERI